MSLKELVKIADYYDIKYSLNKEAQEDYRSVGVYSTPNRPARTWTNSEIFESKEPYILEDKPGFIERNWNAAKGMAKDYISNQTNQSSKVPPAKPKPTAPNTQNPMADAAKQLLKKLPPGLRPQIPASSNNQLTKLQKDLYALKAKANGANDPALAKQVNDFIYQVSQNKLSLSQIQSKMNELNGKLNPAPQTPQTQQTPQTPPPSSQPTAQPTTNIPFNPTTI